MPDHSIPAGKGTGRRLKLAETLQGQESKLSFDLVEKMPSDADGIRAWTQRLLDNPATLQAYAFNQRRHKGTTRVQREMVSAKTLHEPLLNADGRKIEEALQRGGTPWKMLTPKGQLYERLVVKPLSAMAAKAERKNAFWGERLWNVYTTKYGRKLVIVTDHGGESRAFNSMGELRSAIKKSGWEIVR